MEYVNLYTRQNEKSLLELEKKGFIANKKFYVMLHMRDIAPFFLEKYDLFVKLAERIVPRPEGVDYPIWCSVCKDNCLKPIDGEIVYALSVPKDEVIYFDGGKWDYVLNNLYIPKDEEDQKEFDELLKKNNLTHTFDIFDRKYTNLYPDVKKKLIDSWSRIFEITDRSRFVVQANLWQIKKEWIKHIIRPGDDFFKIVSDMEETWIE